MSGNSVGAGENLSLDLDEAVGTAGAPSGARSDDQQIAALPITSSQADWAPVASAPNEAVLGRRDWKASDDPAAGIPDLRTYLCVGGLVASSGMNGVMWVQCPAHCDAESPPTLRITLADGSFYCRGCGASGRGVVALHRFMTGLRTTAAVHDLQERFHD